MNLIREQKNDYYYYFFQANDSNEFLHIFFPSLGVCVSLLSFNFHSAINHRFYIFFFISPRNRTLFDEFSFISFFFFISFYIDTYSIHRQIKLNPKLYWQKIIFSIVISRQVGWYRSMVNRISLSIYLSVDQNENQRRQNTNKFCEENIWKPQQQKIVRKFYKSRRSTVRIHVLFTTSVAAA